MSTCDVCLYLRIMMMALWLDDDLGGVGGQWPLAWCIGAALPRAAEQLQQKVLV